MTVKIAIRENVAVITIDNPPVNASSHAVRQGLVDCFSEVATNDDVKSIVLACAGRTFVAGADISEFGKPPQEPHLPDVFNLIEQSEKPVVAAIHGTALGGGLELALACHYRLALNTAKIGLPEVTLGLIPGAGGTQRLPRIAGIESALNMITSGKMMSVLSPVGQDVVDLICEENLVEQAIEFVLARQGEEVPRSSERPLQLAAGQESIFDEWRASVQRKARGQIAPLKAIDAIEQGLKQGFAAGLKTERDIFTECKASSQSTAMRHAFFAERQCSKIEGMNISLQPKPIDRVAVIGAGTMGGGIAMCFASAGVDVYLLELAEENLERGLGMIDDKYQRSVDTGRISQETKEACIDRIQGTMSYEDLRDVDLVVEAAFESMQVKRDIFTRLDEVCKPETILSSNTSYLDIDEIAAVTNRPKKVIGMHFFSPAHVMKLLEVVKAEQTDDETIITAMAIGKKIGKLCCAVGVCYGFVGNRMYAAYGREFNMMLLEGATPAQLDKAMTDWGMAMGPASVTDLTGIDIGYKARRERPNPVEDPLFFRASDLMVENERLGQKTSAGFYKYVDGVKQDDPEVETLLKSEALRLGIAQREITTEEIQERLSLTLINEGAKILDEGIAARAGDIDVIWLNGYGFPRWRGGPMCYASELGLDHVYSRLCHYKDQFGEEYWSVAPLIEELAENGESFAD